MSDAFRPTSDSTSPVAPSRPSSIALRIVAACCIVGTLGAMSYSAYSVMQDRAAMQQSYDQITEMRGLVMPVQKHLAAEYTDLDNSLLADSPTDPAEWLNPDTLVLSHYVDMDAEQQLVDWQALKAALAEATGKQVMLDQYQNTADDVAAVKAGKIQIVAMHAADAPYVVNNAGYVPIAVLGTEQGANGNRLDIAVPADSKIKTLNDIRGHKLTCTAPDSMTGYRAAIVTLIQHSDLKSDVDYSINFSLGQKKSVLGLVAGEFAVAALSDDKLRNLVDRGVVKSDDVHIIYQSDVIPRLTIGYVYNLDPALAKTVSATVLAFDNRNGSTDESSGGAMHFMPIDYARDFEFVRTVDDSFDPRFSKAAKAKTPSARADRPTAE